MPELSRRLLYMVAPARGAATAADNLRPPTAMDISPVIKKINHFNELLYLVHGAAILLEQQIHTKNMQQLYQLLSPADHDAMPLVATIVDERISCGHTTVSYTQAYNQLLLHYSHNGRTIVPLALLSNQHIFAILHRLEKFSTELTAMLPRVAHVQHNVDLQQDLCGFAEFIDTADLHADASTVQQYITACLQNFVLINQYFKTEFWRNLLTFQASMHELFTIFKVINVDANLAATQILKYKYALGNYAHAGNPVLQPTAILTAITKLVIFVRSLPQKLQHYDAIDDHDLKYKYQALLQELQTRIQEKIIAISAYQVKEQQQIFLKRWWRNLVNFFKKCYSACRGRTYSNTTEKITRLRSQLADLQAMCGKLQYATSATTNRVVTTDYYCYILCQKLDHCIAAHDVLCRYSIESPLPRAEQLHAIIMLSERYCMPTRPCITISNRMIKSNDN